MNRLISFVNKIGDYYDVVEKIRNLHLYEDLEEDITIELPLFIEVDRKQYLAMEKKTDMILSNPSYSGIDEYDESCMLYGRLVAKKGEAFYLSIYAERLLELVELGQIKVMCLIDGKKTYLIRDFSRTPMGKDRLEIENAYSISYNQLFNKESVTILDPQAKYVNKKNQYVLADQVASLDETLYSIFTLGSIPLVIEVEEKDYMEMKKCRKIALYNKFTVLSPYQDVSFLYSNFVQKFGDKYYLGISMNYLLQMVERRKKEIIYFLRDGEEYFIESIKPDNVFHKERLTLYNEHPKAIKSLCNTIVDKYLFEEPVLKTKTPE